MLADALDTARLPDSHVQEDADRVDAEREFRPWWAHASARSDGG
jgi:hypothetical protein